VPGEASDIARSRGRQREVFGIEAVLGRGGKEVRQVLGAKCKTGTAGPQGLEAIGGIEGGDRLALLGGDPDRGRLVEKKGPDRQRRHARRFGLLEGSGEKRLQFLRPIHQIALVRQRRGEAPRWRGLWFIDNDDAPLLPAAFLDDLDAFLLPAEQEVEGRRPGVAEFWAMIGVAIRQRGRCAQTTE
jgi:hypothetical protein